MENMKKNDPGTQEALSFVRRTIVVSAAILLFTLIAALIWGNTRIQISLAAGFAVASASFAILSIVVIRLLVGKGSSAWVFLLGIFKIILVGVLLWWIVSKGIVEPLSFLGGFSTLVMALMVEMFRIKRA